MTGCLVHSCQALLGNHVKLVLGFGLGAIHQVGLGGRHSASSGEDVFGRMWEGQLEALPRVLTGGNESMM